MDESAALRASDQERERVAGQLREHFAAGRIDAEELSERLEHAYRARTVGELADLIADLPASKPLPAERRAQIAERRSQLRARLIQQAGGSLSVFALCCAIWAASGAEGSFWPVWVAIAPAMFLARNLWRLYGPAPELDRVEAALGRRARRRGGRHAARRAMREPRVGVAERPLAAPLQTDDGRRLD
ncbi:MAG TPA: DUF1707 domain-containing protein [Solirubrobacteraceae bacterium]|nr:DUF1707 domain-containing protein [Solirubrobacteraceae bacterium]